jgi:hypothetical protein
MPVIPALGKVRQENHEFKTSLGCIVGLSETKQNKTKLT